MFVRTTPTRLRMHTLNMARLMEDYRMTLDAWRVLARFVVQVEEEWQGMCTLHELAEGSPLTHERIEAAVRILRTLAVLEEVRPGVYAVKRHYLYAPSTIAKGKRRLGRAYARKQLEHWAEVTRDATS